MKILSAAVSVFVSLAVAIAPASAQIAGVMTRIGVAGAVQGKVGATLPGPKHIGRNITSGKDLYLNDEIVTGPDSHLQIMLLDETVFTLGPNSSMVLDEFFYDPKTDSGKVTAKINKGAFRFITGRIGHKQPSDMKVKFPVGSMGIRGTIVAGVVTDHSTMAVLLGPGPATRIPGERIGAFTLGNAAGSSVEVNRPGFGTHIDSVGGQPSIPALVPQAVINSIQTSLSAQANDRPKPVGQQGSEEGGQSRVGVAPVSALKQDPKTPPAPASGAAPAAQPGMGPNTAAYNPAMPAAIPGSPAGTFPGAMPAAMAGNPAGTFPGAMPAAMPGSPAAAFPGAMPESAAMGNLSNVPSADHLFAVLTYMMPAPAPGAMPGVAPGPMPGGGAGTAPAAAPGTMPGGAAGTMPGGAAGTMPGGAPGTMPASGDPGMMMYGGTAGMPAAGNNPGTYYGTASGGGYTPPNGTYIPPPAYVPPPTCTPDAVTGACTATTTGVTNLPINALWDDLRAIPAGTGDYIGAGTYGYAAFAANPAGNGTMNFKLHVDFGAKTIGGGGAGASFITVGGPVLVPDTTQISAIPFASLSGLAAISLNSAAGNSTNARFNTTQINILNSSTVRAASAMVSLVYTIPGGGGVNAGGTMTGSR